MSRRRHSQGRFVSVICFAAVVLHASDDARLYRELVNIPERGDVTGYVLSTKDYELSFISPAKWSVKFDGATDAATLLPPGLEAGISISIDVQPFLETTPTLSDRLREGILKRYPDATIVSEFTSFAGGKRGVVIDFERRIEKDEVQTSFRRALFEFDEGLVEFELRASSARFPDYHHAFGALLNSLKITFPAAQTHLAAARKAMTAAAERRSDASALWSD